jgi:hypothetical protein
MTERPTCTSLDANDIQQCRVRGCTARASHLVTWPTKAGASGSYRCRVHAREFADKYGVEFREVSP